MDISKIDYAAFSNLSSSKSMKLNPEKWSNNINEPKCIIFDADFPKAKLSMSNEELTREDVMSQIDVLPSYQKDMIKYLLWY